MATDVARKLFTVHDYHRMGEAEILRKDDRVELIRGEVLAMSPIGPPHNGTVLRASNALCPIVGPKAIVGVHGAVRLDQFDEPQPDIVLLRPREDFYTKAHAGPADIFLIIEIADSSLEYDKDLKAALYAETGVAEYWVADIPNDCLWAYSNIKDSGYSSVRQFHRDDDLAPQLLPGCRIRVRMLLP
jgi:Uma2 family endonuclease